MAFPLSICAGKVHAQTALNAIMAKKQTNIAVPTDYPPYGFVGTDMAPQDLDIEMAKLIAFAGGGIVAMALLIARTARWPGSPASCCATRSPRRWTLSWSARCCASSRPSPRRA